MKASIWLLAVLAAALGGASAQGQARAPSIIDAASNAGIGAYQPGAWGMAHVLVENPTSEELRALVVTGFVNQPDIQFASEVALPPGSRRICWQPLRCPEEIPQNALGVETYSLLLDGSRKPEYTWSRRSGGQLRVETQTPMVGVLSGHDEGLDTVLAMKRAMGLSNRAIYFSPSELPAIPAGLEALDCLVLTGGISELDDAQLAALRAWVLAGGKLWIMFDQASSADAARLLREDWPVQEVDRVALTHVALEGEHPSVAQDFEEPVELVRLTAPGMEVLQRVNGWPASLRQRVGEGWVLVTALGPRGWVDNWGLAGGSLAAIAEWFMKPRADSPLPPKALEPYLAAQIGYRILDRLPMALIFGALLALMLGTGVVLALKRRLEGLAPLSAALALLAAGAFLGIGLIHRHRVPLTVAGAQFVRAAPSQQEAIVTGLLSVYSPLEGQGPIQSLHGGVVWPDMTGQAGSLLRMVWTDVDKWQWRGLKLPSGATRLVQMTVPAPLPQPAEVRLTYDSQGLRGKLLAGAFEDIMQPILATPGGHLALRLGEDHTLTASESDVLPVGVYLLAGGWDASAQRRAAVYQRLLNQRSLDSGDTSLKLRKDFPDRPVFLAWAKPLDAGITLAQEAVRRDSALVMLPVTWERPAAGAMVKIPSAMLSYHTLRRSKADASGGLLYDSNLRQWLEVARPEAATVWFDLPAEVRPLRVSAGKLTVAIRAVGWRLEALGYQQGKPVSLGTRDNVMGEAVFEAPDGAGLEPGSDGRVRILLRVSGDEKRAQPPLWKINDLKLELAGQVGQAGH